MCVRYILIYVHTLIRHVPCQTKLVKITVYLNPPHSVAVQCSTMYIHKKIRQEHDNVLMLILRKFRLFGIPSE